jgi:hypothetical protein
VLFTTAAIDVFLKFHEEYSFLSDSLIILQKFMFVNAFVAYKNPIGEFYRFWQCDWVKIKLLQIAF